MSAVSKQDYLDRAGRCVEAWSLRGVSWLDEDSTAKIAFCESKHGPAVLKLSTEPNMIGYEHKALRYFGHDMCPTVYAYSEEQQALLLERVGDGTNMAKVYPDAKQEVEVFLSFYREIDKGDPAPEGFPTLATFAEVFDRVLATEQSTVIESILRKASEHCSVLMEGNLRLLHGDAHHFNIISDERGGWRLIDPHGVIGNPLYELGAFLRNPWPYAYTEPGVRERLVERIEILSRELSQLPSAVALFGFYGAAFSLAWDIEQGELFEGMITMSNELAMLAGV